MANIDQTAQLNKLLQQQNSLYEEQGKMLRGQLLIMKQIADTFERINPGAKKDSFEEITDTLDKTSEKVGALGEKSQLSSEKYNKLASSMFKSKGGIGGMLKKFGKLSATIGGVGLAATAFTRTFKLATGAIGAVTNVAGTAISSFTDLAFSIITFPFKMLQGLIDMAGSGGDTGLRQAIEDIRMEFGDLRTGAAKATLDISRNLQGQLAETGLSTWRIFGNLAERLKAITEIAKNMGVVFDLVRNTMVQNAERVAVYTKGLGLSAESQRAMAETAVRAGTSVQEVGRQMTTFAFQMGEAFNINGKQISRDVGRMMEDFDNFGNLGVQELTNISVYARQLGVDFEKLLGVVDKFDNFENAAESAAQLSQAFGLNIDAMKLMQEQDPAARIEQLRKAFFEAGRSVESMTRQERALLSQQTGLDQKTLSLAFSLENQSVSYQDIQKQSEATEKKQLSQAEAMEKLSNSIERMVKQGHQAQGGFFDRFIQGFSIGIRRSHEFRKVMWRLRRTLRVVFRSGIQVGRAFVESFPGIKQVFQGLQDMFDPRMWMRRMREVIGAFRQFFEAVAHDPRQALKDLFSNLKGVFFDMFSPAGGSQIIEGFKTFWLTVFRVGVEAVSLGIDELINFVRRQFSPGGGGNLVEIVTKAAKDALNAIINFDWDGLILPVRNSLISAFNFGLDFHSQIDYEKIVGDIVEGFGKALEFVKERAMAALTNIFDIMNMVDWGKVQKLTSEGISLFYQFIISRAAMVASTAIDFLGEGLMKLGEFLVNWDWEGHATTGLTELTNAFVNFLTSDFLWSAIGALADSIIGIASKLPDMLQMLVDIGVKMFGGLIDSLTNTFRNFIPGAREAIRDAVPVIVEQVLIFGAKIIEVTTDIFTRLPDILGNMVKEIPGVLAKIGPLAEAAWDLFVEVSIGAAEGILDALVSFAPEFVGKWYNMLQRGIDSITNFKNKIKGILDEVKKFFGSLFEGITTSIDGAIGGIKTAINNIIGFLTRTINKVASTMETLGVPGADFVKGIAGSLNDLKGTVNQEFDSIGETLKGGVNATKRGVEGAVDAAAAATESAAGTLSRPFRNQQQLIAEAGIRAAQETAKATQEQVKAAAEANEDIVENAAKSSQNVAANRAGGGAGGPGGRGQKAQDLSSVRTSIRSMGADRFSRRDAARLRRGMRNIDHVLSGESNKRELSYADFSSKTAQSLTQISTAGAIIGPMSGMLIQQAESVSELAKLAEIFSNENVKNFDTVRERSLARVSNSITAMVETINEIQGQLKNLPAAAVNSDLKLLANKLGLGSTDRLTIQHGDLTVRVNVNVRLDVEDLEEAIGNREGGSSFQVTTKGRRDRGLIG